VPFSCKPQTLSLTYECKHETKKKKSFIEKSKELQKIVIIDTKSCPVQLESSPSKVSCHRINYRPKTIGDDCCTIVRLSSDAVVRWDYCPNPNHQFTDNKHRTYTFREFSSSASLWRWMLESCDVTPDLAHSLPALCHSKAGQPLR